MTKKLAVGAFVALPSLFYLLEASGVLGTPGWGFAFTGSRLIWSAPFALFAFPIYIFSFYPPVWWLLAAGMNIYTPLISRLGKSWLARISILLMIVSALITFRYEMQNSFLPFGWTRLVLSAATWAGVRFMFRAKH